MRIVLSGDWFFAASLTGCRTGAAAHAAATMGTAAMGGRALSVKCRQHMHAAGNGEQGHQQHAAKRARQSAMNVAGAKHVWQDITLFILRKHDVTDGCYLFNRKIAYGFAAVG